MPQDELAYTLEELKEFPEGSLGWAVAQMLKKEGETKTRRTTHEVAHVLSGHGFDNHGEEINFIYDCVLFRTHPERTTGGLPSMLYVLRQINELRKMDITDGHWITPDTLALEYDKACTFARRMKDKFGMWLDEVPIEQLLATPLDELVPGTVRAGEVLRDRQGEKRL